MKKPFVMFGMKWQHTHLKHSVKLNLEKDIIEGFAV